MNRGKTVTTSPPREKFSTFSLSKALFVGLDKVGGIVEVLNIVPPILFWAVPGPAHKVFNSETFIFSDCALIEKAVNFKGLLAVGVTFYKYRGGLLRPGPVEEILGRGWGWLKLGLAQAEPQRKQGRSSSRLVPPACRQGDRFSQQSGKGRRTVGLAS